MVVKSLEKDDEGYYLIGSSADLREFADLANGEEPKAKGKLINNIEFNGGRVVVNRKLQKGDFEKWTPIGTEKKPFEGELKGDGGIKKIIGLYVDNEESDHQGLFGYIEKNGRVKNIELDGSYIRGKRYVGGIGGYNQGKISDCITDDNIIIGKPLSIKSYGGVSVGGNVGWNGGTITGNCKNNGAVKGEKYVGGNVGLNYSEGKITGECRNSGAVKGEEDYVGCNYGMIIGKCENSGAVNVD